MRISLAAGMMLNQMCAPVMAAAAGQPGEIALPAPSEQPQLIAADTDSYLQALNSRSGTTEFMTRVAAAAAALPALGERAEELEAARAARGQARSGLFPTLGIDFVAGRTVARDLQSPSTQLEGLVPLQRNDVIGSVDQLVTDFGAVSARVRAGTATTDAARADLDAARNTALLQLVGSWYEVLATQTALALARDHAGRMQTLAKGAAQRFAAGVDSGGDVARARAYLASAESRQIGLERQLKAAEARFTEIFGSAPGPLARPDVVPGEAEVRDWERPELVSARRRADAASAAEDAARAERLPRLDARISGSTYDVLRGATPAYDVRAQLTLRQRFSLGGAEAARVAELAARRRAAGLAVSRIAAAAEREAVVADADVEGLGAAMPALEASYLDSRRARDLFAEQFRVSRGNLFDVLRAERDLLDAALALSQGQMELDVARFTRLARRGGLIERFGLTPAVLAEGQEPRR